MAKNKNKNKDAGSNFEYRVRDKAIKAGIPARRQVLSGAMKDHPGDVIFAEKIIGECKLRTLQKLVSGDETFSFHMSWFDQVEQQAKDHKMDFGILLIQPKYKKKMLAIIDADILFSLIAKVYK